jgi:predicted transposase YbfD/YdcC
MEKVTRFLFLDQPLFRVFFDIKDPRVGGRCLHPLINIIFIALCALISGANGWQAIENFGKERKRWLSQFINLENGIPSHLTFMRVLSSIDPIVFEQCIRKFISKISQLLEFDIINIDGKTACGSGHVNGDKKNMHLINAYLLREKVSLGSVRTPDKSNEIKGIPILLNALNIAGSIITMDAMGTQKGIANLIRIKQANYVLALKKNHKKFYKKVESTFTRANELQFESMVSSETKTDDYGHQRIEEREYTILPMMYFFKFKNDWRDLQAVVRVKSKRIFLDKKKADEESTRYYITSLPFKMHEKMCEAIRTHWAVENNLHWKLDVGLHEDDCQIYRGFADQNLAAIRKVVLALLEKEKSFKGGIELKRHKATLSTRYLRKVVGL